MEKKINILAIIPARGGSKGVPSKNIRPMLGKSLVERTFETARQSKLLDKIILSTDNEDIASVGKKIGLEVPFIRPVQYALDTSSMLDVVLHALNFLEQTEDYQPDAVMVLQPTSPLRKTEHIETAIQLLKDKDAVCSLVQLPMEMSPHYVMKITAEGYLDYFLEEGRKIKRRQDAARAFLREGTIYLAKVETLFKYNNFYGDRCVPMIIPNEESLSIDTKDDWKLAEKILSGIAV